MSCCGKAKKILGKGKAIAKGATAHITGKKYTFTDGRIRTCRKCEDNYWLGRKLFCSICKCFVPWKARVETEKCPKDKWDK